MRARVLPVLAALLVLAGCLGNDASAPTGTIESGQLVDDAAGPDAVGLSADGVGVEVPVWSVGDAWTGNAHDGEETRPITLVVTRADGASYFVETTDQGNAGWDAMFDISYLGAIRASDLAGAQQGQPVQFFSFPLTDGKTWTTLWDGREVQLAATKSARGFDIVGTIDGEPYVELDYVPALRWWSKLRFAEGYGITIDAVQSAWTGTLVSATAKLVYEGHPAVPVASPGAGTFTMDEGQAFGVVTVTGGGTQWARAFYLVQPDHQPYLTQSITNAEAEFMGRTVFLYEEIPAIAGTWQIVAPAVHDPAGAFHLSVHQVAVTPREFP